MQKFLIISLSCLLVSCSSFKGEQGKIYDKLQSWDKVLYEKPGAILDSLKTIYPQELSDKNKAYYSLLITIARNKSDITEKSDSTISFAVYWYRDGKDYRNICRSVLYKDIVKENLNNEDSFTFIDLQNSEKIFYRYNVQDSDFESQIYTCLGKGYLKVYYSSSDISSVKIVPMRDQEAKTYIDCLKKSIDINRRLNYPVEVQKAKIELSKIYLSQQKKKEAFDILNSFGNPDSLSLKIKYDLYYAFKEYYSSVEDYIMTIEYLKRMLEVDKLVVIDNLQPSSLYRQIGLFYKITNQPDSALLYAKLALKSAQEYSEGTIHSDISLLAGACAATGDYKSAYENSEKVLRSYLVSQSRNNKDKVLVSKSWLSHQGERPHRLEREKSRLSIIVILLLLGFSFVFLLLMKKRRTSLKERSDSEKQIAALQTELKKARFVNLIHETSVGALPKLVDDVNKHASRTRKFSSELSDDLNDTINNIRSFSKNNLSAIAQSETFLSANPNVKCLTSLSDLEIIILILVDLKFSTKEISDLLNNTQASVRAIKTKIKDKILATENLPFDPEITFRIFSKDQNHRN